MSAVSCPEEGRLLRRVLCLLVGVSVAVALCAGGAFPVRAADGPVTPDDIKKLGEILKEGTGYKARAQAARALGMLRSADGIPFLLRGLEKDPDQLVRGACAWALGSINHPGALDALVKAKTSDVSMVKTQANRAIDYIVAALPGNLSSVLMHVSVDDLKDSATKQGDLTPWVQQYFVERLVLCPNVELGTEMDIEEEGAEHPSPSPPMGGSAPKAIPSPSTGEGRVGVALADKACPPVRLALVGGLDAMTVPKGRGAGDVEVSLRYSLVLLALDKKMLAGKQYKGKAKFVGGVAPDDPWADDPLLEVQKQAVGSAVALGYADLATYLGLPK